MASVRQEGESSPVQSWSESGYAKVEGRDASSIEALRLLEARAAQKTASDYAHVVWAYAVMWALFVGYASLLWRRTSRLRRDLEALRRLTGGNRP